MSWRDDLAAMKAEVHDTFKILVTLNFAGGALANVPARHHRAGAVVGEEGYAQAVIEADQLVFMLADLAGNSLVRGLSITTPTGAVKVAEVLPVDIAQQTVIVGPA